MPSGSADPCGNTLERSVLYGSKDKALGGSGKKVSKELRVLDSMTDFHTKQSTPTN